jgi:hypothetical protein
MDKFEQFGYEFAGAGFTQEVIVRSLLDATSNKFATEVSDDQRKSLNKGLALRYAERHAELNQHYVLQGENYIAVDDKAFKSFKGAKYHMTVANLLSIDKSEISKMAQHDKPRHNLVKTPRIKAMNYLTDTVKDMQTKARNLLASPDGKKPRKANLNFEESVEAMLFDAKLGLAKKAINAKASGDNSYNDDRWLRSVKAFKAEWLK